MKSVGFALATLLFATLVNGQTLPPKFSRATMLSNLGYPTSMAFTPDGRILFTDQEGSVFVIKNGSLLPNPFVQLSVDSRNERGLLGIAIDPDFSINGYVYLFYTVPTDPIHNRVSRFTASGDAAVPGSEVIILEMGNLSTAENHNGGCLGFGTDGKLFVSTGDNGGGSRSQDPDMYFGKMLRINKDGSVPAGNPFATGTDQKKSVWSMGLRNAFSFSVQPGTGRLFVNDVGELAKEEINDASLPGLNFGWPAEEGFVPNSTYTNPIFEYEHGDGDGKGCAITAGTFYNPTTPAYPAKYVGAYFYIDYCNNWINYLDLSSPSPVRHPFGFSIGGLCLALQFGPDGNLYYLSRDDKKLYSIVYDSAAAPVIVNHPSSLSVDQGQVATFSVSATGKPSPGYQWQRNSINIPGATGSSYAISAAQPGDIGSYRVVVSNSLGTVTSNAATLSVNIILDVSKSRTDLLVYPIPARDIFYIRSRSRVQSVSILDNVGSRVDRFQTKELDDGTVRIINALPAGLYFLRIHSISGTEIVKVLISN